MIIITEPFWVDNMDQSGFCSPVECHDSARPTLSRILGKDGKPIPYQPINVGFDLRPLKTRS